MPVNHDEITLDKIQSLVTITNKTILEIGCGDGRVTRYLTDSPKQLIALDPDGSKFEEAKQNAPFAQYLSSSGLELPFAASTFDLVLFTLSLHHHPDCAAALTEAKRVLRPDGRVLVLEPLNEGELEQICNVFNDEGQVLAAAQSAIDSSEFRFAGSEVFATEWHFDNAQALVDWLFEFYERLPDPEMADDVHELLSDKINDAPLVLEDLTVITCLAQ